MSARTWFDGFLAREAQARPECMAYLDRGLAGSPCESQVVLYPARLALPPQPCPVTPNPPPFPRRGQAPSVDEQALDFLHPDVVAACVAVGRLDETGTLRAHWYGRNAATSEEMWSATKILPMVRTVALENRASAVAIHDTAIRDPGGHRPDQGFAEVLADIVTYAGGDDLSNAQARTLKHFDTPERLEEWTKAITGNPALRFRGGYGVTPTVVAPVLVDRTSGRVLLQSPRVAHTGDNAVSACDMARLMGMLGWDAHLPQVARFPHVRRTDLAVVSQALGADRARYLDVALEVLGLADRTSGAIILSKMGFGDSLMRSRTECVYAAFLRCDSLATGGGTRPLMLALALKVARPSDEPGACFVTDARMAASVTEVLDHVVRGSLP